MSGARFIRTVAAMIALLPAVVATAQVATIDFANIKQDIDGFGASSAWHGQLTDAQLNAAFGTGNNQLGLTILRIRIDPSSGAWADEKANAQKAKTRGAQILASPWTPPASMKTNNNTVGGELKTDSYAAYASHLKSFCDNLGNVDVISIQNEPNITVTYESCDWNATQLLNFCKNNAASIGKPVLMPETYNFDISYSDPTLNDPAAAATVSYIGLHLYGATMKNYTNALDKGKKLWMTEYYLNPDDIGTCMTMGKQILDCMYNNMNAYIWWYLRMPDCNIINTDGSIKKKGYVLGQFSRFIRPGYCRVDATYQPQSGVYVVAFKGSQNVIVALNQNTTSKNQTFSFRNGAVSNVKKYTTSGVKNIADEGSIAMSGNSFTATLDAQSITTFVGVAETAHVPMPRTPLTDHFQGISLPDVVYLLNGKKWPGLLSGAAAGLPPGVYVGKKGVTENAVTGLSERNNAPIGQRP
ncbi:MAG: glucuronoxylanase [Chitinispirillaceae bacterium]|nr:glucuronoxylanase [Chitinispirillaceae bacterium]